MPSELAQRAGQEPRYHALVQRVEDSRVQTWLKERERAFLFGVGAFMPGRGQVIEIGSWHGSSACYFAGGILCRGEGRLTCVDPHLAGPPWLGLSPERGTYGRFREVTEAVGVASVIDTRLGESESVAGVWPGQLVDAVFIDGDHSFAGALRDFECWAPKTRPGGLIVIDDADDAALPGVLDLIELLKRLDGVSWLETLDGFAVFAREPTDSWQMLQSLERELAPRQIHRPWDMGLLTGKPMPAHYMRSRTWDDEGLTTAYELCFLARCGPGSYAYSPGSDPADRALLDALSADRHDGDVVCTDSAPVACRAVLCAAHEASDLVSTLQPGGVLIARDPVDADADQVFATHLSLEQTDLDGCGWHEQTHWGVNQPRLLSAEAVLDFALSALQPQEH